MQERGSEGEARRFSCLGVSKSRHLLHGRGARGVWLFRSTGMHGESLLFDSIPPRCGRCRLFSFFLFRPERGPAYRKSACVAVLCCAVLGLRSGCACAWTREAESATALLYMALAWADEPCGGNARGFYCVPCAWLLRGGCRGVHHIDRMSGAHCRGSSAGRS